MDRVKAFFESFLLWWLGTFYQVLSWFWKIKHVGETSPYAAPIIYAHWHSDELLLISEFANRDIAVMASRSRDGERLMKVLRRLGYWVVRGSSSQGGAGGLKGLIDAVEKRGISAAIAVDGPRGPIYRVKPGVLKLAQQTGKPILPRASSAAKKHVFEKAWNRCYLPYPGSSCVVVYGSPVWVPKGISEAEFENLRLELERQMISLKVSAEKFFSRNPDSVLQESLKTIGV
jgi:lysophospholipid acyltransferase (LPLAT)-like uncharacterized protein